MTEYELVVVGGGPAAITLAKLLGNKKKMVIIRPESSSMIYCAMPYAIEGLFDIEKTLKSNTLITESGADFIRDTVTEIDFDGKNVTLSDSTQLAYKQLVIATGAEPFIPPVKGSDLKGVSGFKTEKDLSALQATISSGVKKAVVVGAGAIGIELAQALKKAGLEVNLVDMTSSILPNLVDSEMTEDMKAEMLNAGINIHLEAKVVSLGGSEWVQHVELDNGHKIHFEAKEENAESGTHDGIVIFAAGMKAVTDLVKDSTIELGRDGIVINDKMETSLPDVYAVGDCTQFKSAITGKTAPGKLATNAVPMAKVLGFNMMGKNKSYPGFYNGAATKVGKYYVGGTGLSESVAKNAGYDVISGYSEVTTQFPIMPDAKELKFKLVADKATGKILGAQIVSGEPVTGRIDLLSYAIQKNSTVEDLSELSYSSQPYQSFFPAANGVVLAAEDILKKM
ncbi:MAG: FAD-dependent pyridine nucleotide-disulfide oxidoreductase [Spirochaetaceae bacterium 4572_59]|nr:MAG: FAD-dependent pyridine nucleotide-disulfide oxidoreductase [Spirochaetaceae bacterium 4572_59]